MGRVLDADLVSFWGSFDAVEGGRWAAFCVRSGCEALGRAGGVKPHFKLGGWDILKRDGADLLRSWMFVIRPRRGERLRCGAKRR